MNADLTGKADHPSPGSESDLAELLDEALMLSPEQTLSSEWLMRARASVAARSKRLETAAIDYSGQVIPQSSFDGAMLDGSTFAGASALLCDFRGAVLAGSDFSGCDLRDCDFSGARISQDLRGSDSGK